MDYFNGKSDTELDQSRVPRVRIGRVQREDSRRSPDVVGTVSLQNVSPLGQWQVAITAGQKPLVDWSCPATIDPHLIRRAAEIVDVTLSLYLAVRTTS